MPPRIRAVDEGALHGRVTVSRLAQELRIARADRGLSQSTLAQAAGCSRSRVSYIERGLAPSLDLVAWSRLLAAVGLELSVQSYPSGRPIRDAAHAALLQRFRGRIHPRLGWRTEVPLPIPGDLRAWDAMIRGDGWRMAVEAETRPDDWQALERRIALKQRDSSVELVVLLLLDSRRNRRLVRAYADRLADRFPVAGRRALELLSMGASPRGSSLVLL